MLLVRNDCTDPFRNMATEEVLLRRLREPAVMLWRNEPAVIIGKNQDARAEVDFAFAKAHGIRVVRRLTGGGAVFHDLGNVNYTFIVPDGTTLSFSSFAAPILDALGSLGIVAAASGRNDLVADCGGEMRKFSGTAACVYRRQDGSTARMHHGTLLFSADFSALAGVLTPDRDKLASKGIASTRARVVNLQTLLSGDPPMDVTAFQAMLETHFLRLGAVGRDLSAEEHAEIDALTREKYETDAWLFGKFGADDLRAKQRFPYGTVAVALAEAPNSADIPVIARLSFSGDFFGEADPTELEAALLGTPRQTDALIPKLADVSRYLAGASPEEIAALLCAAT